jgi:hypothetical protein
MRRVSLEGLPYSERRLGAWPKGTLQVTEWDQATHAEPIHQPSLKLQNDAFARQSKSTRN